MMRTVAPGDLDAAEASDDFAITKRTIQSPERRLRPRPLPLSTFLKSFSVIIQARGVLTTG